MRHVDTVLRQTFSPKQPFFLIVFLLPVVAGVPVGHAQTTWRVEANGSGDVATIQAAVDAASNGDVIELGPGTYSDVGNYDVDLKGKVVRITSSGGADVTTMNPLGNGRGFICQTGETSATIIEQLTITGALSNFGGAGGAILCISASPTIQDNVLRGNNGSKGSAIGITGFDSAPVITRNVLSFNGAIEGGAIYSQSASPVITLNVMYGNNAVVGSACFFESGGVVEFTRNTVVYNDTGEFSAAVGTNSVSITVDQSIFAFNTGGAGLICFGNGTLSCSLFYENTKADILCNTDLGNNLFEDPQFCGVPGSNIYKLQTDSPCAPANNACGELIGALWPNCGAVKTVEGSWGAMKKVYEGQ